MTAASPAIPAGQCRRQPDAAVAGTDSLAVQRFAGAFLGKQAKGPGAGRRLADRQRRTNAHFAATGLFTLTEARANPDEETTDRSRDAKSVRTRSEPTDAASLLCVGLDLVQTRLLLGRSRDEDWYESGPHSRFEGRSGDALPDPCQEKRRAPRVAGLWPVEGWRTRGPGLRRAAPEHAVSWCGVTADRAGGRVLTRRKCRAGAANDCSHSTGPPWLGTLPAFRSLGALHVDIVDAIGLYRAAACGCLGFERG